VRVSVVQVRVVRVLVPGRRVTVPQWVSRLWLGTGMVRVARVGRVGVDESLVPVRVLVPLGQVQPHPERHQCARDEELPSDLLPEQRHRHDGPEEWGD
jgi:hypothetical protein